LFPHRGKTRKSLGFAHNKGYRIALIETAGSWSRVRWPGQNAWVPTAHITKAYGTHIMNVEHIFEGINPTTTKTAYYIYGLIGVAIGPIQVGYSAAELGQPTWLTLAIPVFSFIAAASGIP